MIDWKKPIRVAEDSWFVKVDVEVVNISDDFVTIKYNYCGTDHFVIVDKNDGTIHFSGRNGSQNQGVIYVENIPEDKYIGVWKEKSDPNWEVDQDYKGDNYFMSKEEADLWLADGGEDQDRKLLKVS